MKEVRIMAKNQKTADAAAKLYFYTQKRIAILEVKREGLIEQNKTEKSILIFAEIEKITSQIEAAYQELNLHARLVVENLYEEEQDEQQE